jgi:flagellin
MVEITNMILRMRELAVQMENGIYTAKDRDNAQLEVNALLAEVDKIANNTRFNDVKVLDGSYDQTIRAGNTNAETIRVNVGSLKTADNAKITGFALNTVVSGGYSGGSADGIDANGSDTDLEVTMGQTAASTVEITTANWSSAFKALFKQDSLGVFSITAGADHDNFSLDTKTGKLTSVAALAASGDANTASGDADSVAVVYTPRTSSGLAAHTETIQLHVRAATEQTLSTIKVETQSDATHAVETLDKALEEVSTAQAKLGAIQNRLSHNIDNLSKGSMLTEQSVGRIVDADFATETSELSKQQILAQAATSMLAQANQSKQSVLALLQ